MARVVNIVGRALRGADRIAFPFFRNGEPGVFLDPTDISTLFQDTAGTVPVTTPGQTVARVNDKSGNGNHATQPTAAARPTYQVDAATGLGYLSFDGVDDFLQTPTITPNTDKVQLFAGVRKLSDAARGVCFGFGNPASFDGTFDCAAPNADNSANYGLAVRGESVGRTYDTAATFFAPRSDVVSFFIDISENEPVSMRVSGNTAPVSSSGTHTPTSSFTPRIGHIGSRSGTSRFFNGHIHQLITRFGPNLSTADIEKAERYVASKTAGVTL